jgi:hypothetical protein
LELIWFAFMRAINVVMEPRDLKVGMVFAFMDVILTDVPVMSGYVVLATTLALYQRRFGVIVVVIKAGGAIGA